MDSLTLARVASGLVPVQLESIPPAMTASRTRQLMFALFCAAVLLPRLGGLHVHLCLDGAVPRSIACYDLTSLDAVQSDPRVVEVYLGR